MDGVVHFEIPVVNMTRAQKFYKSAFGWKVNPVPDMDYTILWTAKTGKNGMVKKPGTINGGMMKRTNPVKSPVITINVKNIDQALKDIRKFGGKIVKDKMGIGDMGYAAYIRDTENNVIGLWQNTGRGM